MAAPRPIRTGIGGWTFEPWRANFYPAGLPHSRELSYASRQLTAIEVNGTYYSTFTPATFARWRDETPGSFVFALKANRFTTHRRVLAEAGDSVERFVASGIAELGEKLGPIVWQFMPTKRFEAEDFAAFLALLPRTAAGVPLRHALDVRHPSFMCPEFLALARQHGCASVFTHGEGYPCFADLTADFVYARLMGTRSHESEGYPAEVMDRWADTARSWAAGENPAGAPCVEPDRDTRRAGGRDVFMFFISGAKERAPAAAMALGRRLGLAPAQA